jgi:hypothetical protein
LVTKAADRANGSKSAQRLNPRATRGVIPSEEWQMTDHKKKGDFDQARKHDVGGNKKQDNSDNSPSRTGNQNAGHGGRD